ncbi:Vitelline membrane outer layer protein 1 [Folsomia candida]|uniref:Vitelline membrane outer layer protein 1 n=1 Tax=Folsomia candida TaxID=158441 RepID=A0A226DL05_FOLCA|nr:Vitelline membrane outer layer protein 1 [Folsomia candida]
MTTYMTLLLCCTLLHKFSGGFHHKFSQPDHGHSSSSRQIEISNSTARRIGEVWLKSPPVTSWGDWGEQSFCPRAAYAWGIRVKYEPLSFWGDDNSAINGLGLNCIFPDGNLDGTNPSSNVGDFGKWLECICPSQSDRVVGVGICRQPPQGEDDDISAYGFYIICRDSGEKVCVDEKRIRKSCYWMAFRNQYRGICGIHTQVQGDQGFWVRRFSRLVRASILRKTVRENFFGGCNFIGDATPANLDIDLIKAELSSRYVDERATLHADMFSFSTIFICDNLPSEKWDTRWSTSVGHYLVIF